MSRSTYFANPEARAFLQRRVAVFGLIGAILGGTALLFRVIMGVLFGFLREQLTDPGFLVHAAAIVPLLGVWLICRQGQFSVNVIHAIENTGIFLASICYIRMGLDIRPDLPGHTPNGRELYPPAPPEPAAEKPRRVTQPFQQGTCPRNERRPANHPAPRQSLR